MLNISEYSVLSKKYSGFSDYQMNDILLYLFIAYCISWGFKV